MAEKVVRIEGTVPTSPTGTTNVSVTNTTLPLYVPKEGNIINGSRTTAGTIITIPAGQVWHGDIQVSATIAAAGVATPNVTVAGTGVEPTAGAVLSRLSITGLAATTVTDSNTIRATVRAPVGNAVTLEFALGGAGSASVVCNGFIL